MTTPLRSVSPRSSDMRGIKAYKCDGRDLMEENVISACARSPIDEREATDLS